MTHNPTHTILRNGSFLFNRRVPKAVQSNFGAAYVRLNLGRSKDLAALLSTRLNAKLEEIWASPIVHPVDLEHLLSEVKPSVTTFVDAARQYLHDKQQGKSEGFEKHIRLAKTVVVSVNGNKGVTLYDRNDARAVLSYLRTSEMKTTTIRRRLDTIRAIFEYAYVEGDVEKRNPFSRLSIPGEGLDAKKRGTFTLAQLQEIYRVALDTKNEIKLIVPILGETGCRLAEVVGLRLQDVDLAKETITITPHPGRRLKTRGSERVLPLVGAALEAMRLLMDLRDDEDQFLLPRYVKDGTVRATHASNAINKWLKRDFDGLTCHCLRHTMRDRLRAVEAPVELIDQIGGWSSGSSIGSSYGRGFMVNQLRAWLTKVEINTGNRSARVRTIELARNP